MKPAESVFIGQPWRYSELKWMAASAAHCRYYRGRASDQTLSMRLGSGAHAMLFGKPWVLYAGKSETGKKKVRNGGAWDEFVAAHPDHVILNQKEHDIAAGMTDAVLGHAEARRLIFGERTALEQRVTWAELGLERSCTPDVRGDDYIVELKSAKSTQPDRFVRAGTFLSYHTQLADQLEGVRLSRLGEPSAALIVAVESTPPHVVTVLRLTEQALDMGRRQRRAWMERLVGCIHDDHWPGYVESIVPFDVDQPVELEFGDTDADDETPDLRTALSNAMVRDGLADAEDFPF